MSEVFDLDPKFMPADIKPGFVTMHAPYYTKPDYKFGVIQIDVAPGSKQGLLEVMVHGDEQGLPDRVEIRRTDTNDIDKNLQIDARTRNPDGRQVVQVLAQPIGELDFVRGEDGWQAQAEGLQVKYPEGMNDFARVVMRIVAKKQKNRKLERPGFAEPEV